MVIYDGMAKGGSAPTKHFVQALRLLASHENDAEFHSEDIAKKIEEAGYVLAPVCSLLISSESFERPLLEGLLKKN